MLSTMNHTRKFKIIALILIIGLSFTFNIPVSAANDDPGQGRLSGDCISEDFYDEAPASFSSLFRRGAGTNAYTGKTYTHQARFNNLIVLNGIDVSEWQGKNIDWNKVKAAGIDYAFIRVGYRGYGSSGTLSEATKDAYYDINMKNAAAAGIKVGIYIFSQAITKTEAVEEANYILNHIGNYDVSMPLIMDYEYATSNGGRLYNAKLSKAKATEICLAFCDTISQAGYTPMVYANKSMLENQLNAASITAKGYRTWLANYTTNTTYLGDFDFWQYSSEGKVNGISGNVDMNFYYVQPDDNFIPSLNKFLLSTVSAIPDQVYTGAEITPAFTVTNDGQTLTPGTDYTISYINNINAGTASVRIIGINEYSGTKTVQFKIMPKNFSASTISAIPDQTYTGKNLTPAATVMYEGKKLTKGTDYTLTYSNNKNIGSASIKISGINNYDGQKTISFNILPKNMTNFKAKKISTNYITLSWSKNSSGTGYEIYRSTAIDGTYKKIKTISSYKTVSYKNTKLTAGERYYYKVRSYKKVGNKTYYGAFSPVKSIDTKIGYTRNANAKAGAILYNSASYEGTQITHPSENAVMPVSYYTKDKNGNGWYYVTYKTGSETYKGFIPTGKVTITQIGKVANAGTVNVRKSYSTNSKILTTLKKNTKVTVLSSKKKNGVTWYKVTFKKKKKTYTGWISSPFLKLI